MERNFNPFSVSNIKKKSTEIPYVNEYFDLKDDGIYVFGGCGQHLYDSDINTKVVLAGQAFGNPFDIYS